MGLYIYNLQSYTVAMYTVAHKHIYTHTHLNDERLDMIPFFYFYPK